MKMIPGTGTIDNYGSYISNCTLGQLPYKVPIPSLQDIQLYINIGTTKPTTVLYELIHTCGANAGQIETLITSTYQIGQDINDNWFGVFKELMIGSGVSLSCFVIAITLDSTIYFSEEFCIDECGDPAYIQGCYGNNLDAEISTDCNGIYFGTHAGAGTPLGSTSVTYKHRAYLRGVEVTLQQIKNNFKQGITRTFRTERERIYQFWSEIIPEWYLAQVDGVFFRGEVSVAGTRYLLNETLFEKVDECLKQWKPVATFKDSCFQSFSCETDPCAEPPEECCDPVFLSATVDSVADESGESGTPPANDNDTIIVVQSIIGGTTIVTGTIEVFTGLSDGSTVVSSPSLAGKRVFIMRGLLPVPGVDPGGGAQYYTKDDADDFITFNTPLVTDEFVYIETIN